jgi:hypothetical protein
MMFAAIFPGLQTSICVTTFHPGVAINQSIDGKSNFLSFLPSPRFVCSTMRFPMAQQALVGNDVWHNMTWNCWRQHYWLVAWNIFYDFPYIGNNNPNWRTHIFQRGRSTTKQIKYYIHVNDRLKIVCELLTWISHNFPPGDTSKSFPVGSLHKKSHGDGIVPQKILQKITCRNHGIGAMGDPTFQVQWVHSVWLVVWNMFFFPFHIWDVILPIH